MLVITGFYSAILALIIICLGARIVWLRVKHRVGVLDGGNIELLKAIRVHGNAVEWIPITLILFACAETLAMPRIELHILGSALVCSRLLHAYGLSRTRGTSFGRITGVLGTWIIMIMLCTYNFYYFVKLP